MATSTIVVGSTSRLPLNNSGAHHHPGTTVATSPFLEPEIPTKPLFSHGFDDLIEGCDHLDEALKSDEEGDDLVRRFTQVCRWAAQEKLSADRRSSGQANKPKRRKRESPSCEACSAPLHRPFACLSCAFVGCFGTDNSHTVDHLAQHGHLFCVDSGTGAVYCEGCDDFIYSPRLEDIFLSIKAEFATLAAEDLNPRPELPQPWQPSGEALSILAEATTISCRGLRGLRNVGATCFLSVVLQFFFHNPLLRNHFLADRHNRRMCKTSNCMSCEMDRLVDEFHSDDSSPWAPITFLKTMWNTSIHLSGYGQQDAHEFFISALNQFHLNAKGGHDPVQQTFSGQLRSDVVCGSCGNTTVAYDPMLDISLDLKGEKKIGKLAVVGLGPGAPEYEQLSLGGCLQKFTSPEKLGQSYTCSSCQTISGNATKRLSISRLPPVLCFQLKRFEHTTSSSTKIDTFVRFPAVLDMTPYTTATLKRRKGGSQKTPTAPSTSGSERCIYDLFAVINHSGASLNTGHYTNFIRYKDEWYQINDEVVTPSTLGACLSSKA